MNYNFNPAPRRVGRGRALTLNFERVKKHEIGAGRKILVTALLWYAKENVQIFRKNGSLPRGGGVGEGF